MMGRSEALWQEEISELDAPRMTEGILSAGYDGLYLDLDFYHQKYGDEAYDRLNELISVLGEPDIISSDNVLYFWKLNHN